jgi:hypothetical protein
MELTKKLPEGDAVQAHFSMVVAFTAMERDYLVKQDKRNPEVKKRLKDVDFMIDEFAIRALERQSPYEC